MKNWRHAINDYSIEEQIKAIKRNADNIRFIINPSEEVQLAAVKEDAYTLYDIKNPSEKVQLEAVKQNPMLLNSIIFYIKNPCQKILDMLMIKDIIE